MGVEVGGWVVIDSFRQDQAAGDDAASLSCDRCWMAEVVSVGFNI